MHSLHQFVVYFIVLLGTINFLHLGLYIAGANIYDVQQFRRRKKLLASKKKRGKRPLVSVIIPAFNEELSIARCLDSIRRNTYRKVEVIVHNDNSKDDTAKIIRAYQKKHPKFNLRLVSRRKQLGKAGGVNYCAKRYAKGDLVMTLDADCMLDKFAIKNAVDYFDDPKILGVAANVKILDEPSVLGILQQFEHMLGYRSKKFYTVANCEMVVGGVASTYRMSVLQKVNFYDTDTQTEDIGLSMKIVAMANKKERIVYAANVLAFTEPVHTFKALRIQRYRWKLGMIQNLIKYRAMVGNIRGNYSKTMTLYRLPMAFITEFTLMLEPFILGYIIYLSIVGSSSMLFLGAYLTICLYVLMGLWPDEHLSFTQKVLKSFYVPVIYFIFYIMDVVQVLAIFKVIFNPAKMLRRGYTESHWTPPARIKSATEAV